MTIEEYKKNLEKVKVIVRIIAPMPEKETEVLAAYIAGYGDGYNCCNTA